MLGEVEMEGVVKNCGTSGVQITLGPGSPPSSQSHFQFKAEYSVLFFRLLQPPASYYVVRSSEWDTEGDLQDWLPPFAQSFS